MVSPANSKGGVTLHHSIRLSLFVNRVVTVCLNSHGYFYDQLFGHTQQDNADNLNTAINFFNVYYKPMIMPNINTRMHKFVI